MEFICLYLLYYVVAIDIYSYRVSYPMRPDVNYLRVIGSIYVGNSSFNAQEVACELRASKMHKLSL